MMMNYREKNFFYEYSDVTYQIPFFFFFLRIL